MAEYSESLAVLIVDENPQILIFFSRLLSNNNMRAFMSRGADEAIAIAERDYLPIDLVMIDMLTPLLDVAMMVYRLRKIRPAVRLLFMSTQSDNGMIWLKLMAGEGRVFSAAEKSFPESGDLIATIRSASAGSQGCIVALTRTTQ